MENKNEAGRLASLRKFIPTPEDAAIVKEMISDGLSNEQILQALGQPATDVPLPNGHEHSNKLTSDQEEAKAAELQQPGEVVGGSEEGDEEGGGGDMLTHLSGLLNSLSKKPNKKVNNGPNNGPKG